MITTILLFINCLLGPYEMGLDAYKQKDYTHATKELTLFLAKYPHSSKAEEARYILGLSYLCLADYGMANAAFSDYLKNSLSPVHFEDVVKYKFFIAEKFRCGAKKRAFNLPYARICASGLQDAKEIYDEVASILPNQEIAGWSLYRKGCLLVSEGAFREGVEAFQTAIRRFPGTVIARQSYVGISFAYLQESKLEANNPDLLCLAMINLKKFKSDFPGDSCIAIVEKQFSGMEEFYAHGFFEMAQFYERTCHLEAAYIYYATTIREFPGTQCAKKARRILLEWCEEG